MNPQRRMENNIRKNNSVFFRFLLARLLQRSSNLVFIHLWGWSSPPTAKEWGSLLLLSPSTEGKGKGSWLVQLSLHRALSLPIPSYSAHTALLVLTHLKEQNSCQWASEHCLGNGWQSMFIFTSTGIQTSAQRDLEPNLRHNIYCFLFRNAATRPQVLLRRRKSNAWGLHPTDSWDTDFTKPWEYR